MLTRAEIKGFKCLRDVDVDLHPFNVLIGPNDSGKSSFLQALVEPSRLWRGQGGRGGVPTGTRSIHLWTKDSDLLLTLGAGSWAAQWNGHRIAVGPPLRREGPPDERGQAFLRVSEPVTLDAAQIASPSPRGSGALADLIASRGGGTAAHIARVALGDRARYDAIQDGIRVVTGGRVREVVVGEDLGSGYPLSFRLYNDAVIPASEMSQGLLAYLGFLALIHRDDAPSVLLIEEPENGLHPLRMFEVVGLLRTLTARGVQIVMATHSPDLLNACKPEEVLVFRRPEPGSSTEVHRLPADFHRRAMGDSLGQVWASTGEEGLLDMLPKIEPSIRAESG
jgi:hypothetical protein